MGVDTESLTISTGIGTSGVSLWYHKQAEYNKLTAAQKRELSEWSWDKRCTGTFTDGVAKSKRQGGGNNGNNPNK